MQLGAIVRSNSRSCAMGCECKAVRFPVQSGANSNSANLFEILCNWVLCKSVLDMVQSGASASLFYLVQLGAIV